jgi:hypothetical protein
VKALKGDIRKAEYPTISFAVTTSFFTTPLKLAPRAGFFIAGTTFFEKAVKSGFTTENEEKREESRQKITLIRRLC